MKEFKFESCFASNIDRFIEFKRSQGYSYGSVYNLQRLDRFAHNLQWALPILNSTFFKAYSDSLKHLKPWGRYPMLCTLRTFSQYLHRHHHTSEVYSKTASKPKPVPGYIYSEQELQQLLIAAGKLRSELHASSFTTMLSLMSATGLRPGEAVSLEIEAFDPTAGTLFIKKGKLGKDRLIPLAASTVTALSLYLDLRRRLADHARAGNAFFLNHFGEPLLLNTAEHTYRELLRSVLIKGHTQRRPRLHDWGHTFAVECLLGWHRQGVDVNARLPILATYLGHVGISETQLYLQATPELMTFAAQCLSDYLDINNPSEHMEVSDV